MQHYNDLKFHIAHTQAVQGWVSCKRRVCFAQLEATKACVAAQAPGTPYNTSMVRPMSNEPSVNRANSGNPAANVTYFELSSSVFGRLAAAEKEQNLTSTSDISHLFQDHTMASLLVATKYADG